MAHIKKVVVIKVFLLIKYVNVRMN